MGPGLDAPEDSCGMGGVHDGKALDIGLQGLRVVGQKRGDLFLQRRRDVHEKRRREVLRGGDFVEDHIADVPCGGDGGLAERPVILVRVFPVIDKREIRLDFFEKNFDVRHHFVHVRRELGVLVGAPEKVPDVHDPGGLQLFFFPERGVSPLVALGHDEKIHVVPGMDPLQKRAPAAEFNVVGVGADGHAGEVRKSGRLSSECLIRSP